MRLTPALMMSRYISEMHEIHASDAMKQKREVVGQNGVKLEDRAFHLLSSFTTKGNIDVFSHVSNNVQIIKDFITSDPHGDVDQAVINLCERTLGSITPGNFGLDQSSFLNRYLSKQDKDQYDTLSRSIRDHYLKNDDEERCSQAAMRAMNEYVKSLNLSENMESVFLRDVDKLMEIVSGASRYGFTQFWKSYLEVSEKLDAVVAAQGRELRSGPDASPQETQMRTASKVAKALMTAGTGVMTTFESLVKTGENAEKLIKYGNNIAGLIHG